MSDQEQADTESGNWLDQYMAGQQVQNPALSKFLGAAFPSDTMEKGGPGSGHWGHAGRPGERGGSLPANVAVSVRTGRTARQRQEAARAAGGRPVGPAGHPVSMDLDLSKAPGPRSKSGKGIRTALAAIDKVHGDGDMPDIPIVNSSTRNTSGDYQYLTGSKKPVRIRVSKYADYPGFTALHEIGHFIDHQGLGEAGVYESERAAFGELDSASPAMKRWFEAAKNSQAIQRLREINDTRKVRFRWSGDAEQHVHPSDREFVRYNLKTKEVFARSYAQYIATRSGDSDLAAELGAQIASTSEGYGYPVQWQTADFEPIAAAFDEIFKEKGWRQ